jgi:hypothetical protein
VPEHLGYLRILFPRNFGVAALEFLSDYIIIIVKFLSLSALKELDCSFRWKSVAGRELILIEKILIEAMIN